MIHRYRPSLLSLLIIGLAASLSGARAAQAQAAPPPKTDDHQAPAPDPAAEADFWNRFSLETAMEIDAGKFGGKTRSTYLSLPATIGYDHGGIIASLSVPYVLQHSTGNAVRIGGRVVRVNGQVQRQAKTEGGLGDLLLDAGYYVIDSQGGQPYLLLDGEVKIPTADDERNLGTGSADETIRASSGVTLWEHLKLYAELGYQFTGQPEDIPSSTKDFKNAITAGGGVGYKFTAANVLWAKVDTSTEIVDRSKPYELVYVEWDHTFKSDSRLLISLGTGLTKASPGLSFELSYLFWF